MEAVAGINPNPIFGAAPPIQVIRRKSVIQTVNNSAALVGIPELALPVGAGDVWAFRLALLCQAASIASDFKFGFDITGIPGTTMRWGAASFNANANAGFNPVAPATTPQTINDQTGSLPVGSTAGIAGVELEGIVYVGTSFGLLVPQFAQNTPTVEDSSILPGSMLVAWKL